MSKLIDPVAIKQAVKDGQLEVFIERGNILIRDTTTREAAKIGDIDAIVKKLETECDANAGGLYKEQIIKIVRRVGWNE